MTCNSFKIAHPTRYKLQAVSTIVLDRRLPPHNRVVRPIAFLTSSATCHVMKAGAGSPPTIFAESGATRAQVHASTVTKRSIARFFAHATVACSANKRAGYKSLRPKLGIQPNRLFSAAMEPVNAFSRFHLFTRPVCFMNDYDLTKQQAC